MDVAEMRQDLLFCRACGKHFRGMRRKCPNDGGVLELVRPFEGKTGDRVDDRYVLETRLGVGGMGTVWRASDSVSGKQVALKLLNARYATHAASAKRFLREARLMRGVVHPGVAALHRFGPTSDGALLIEMEYVAGETLRDRVVRQKSGLPMDLGLRVLDGLLAALAACHDAAVVHCDIKPENVMLVEGGAPGQIKLLDFGIAQPPGPMEHGEDFVVLGTPAFMSPEQVRGNPLDGRADLYLVGCLTFELLTGDPPFTAESPIELCQHQALSPPPTLQERLPGATLPPGLEAWVACLLQKDAQRRFASARAAREQLRLIRQAMRDASMGLVPGTARPTSQGRLVHRDPVAEVIRAPRRPESAPPLAVSVEAPRSIRAIFEVRQSEGSGTQYGPRAIGEIAGHLIAGSLDELSRLGGVVRNAGGATFDLLLPCGADERGMIHHLLDTLGRMQLELSRVPEPELTLRAVVVGDADGTPGEVEGRPLAEVAALLEVGNGSVRIDDRIARWAGRRPIVKLAHPTGDDAISQQALYATTLMPY